MKKHLMIVSFVLVFLLAICAVSAENDFNFSDDEQMSVFKEVQSIGEESIPESDVLMSDDVGVENVTVYEGNDACIPVHVSDSNASLLNGGVNVTLYGENSTISRYIAINNITGQENLTVRDVIQLVGSGGGNLSDIYDMVVSSSNFTNFNASLIVTGLEDINSGFSINTSALSDGINLIINTTQIDSEKLMEGLKDILNGTEINFEDFIKGFRQMSDAVSINSSDFSKFTDVWVVLLDGFNIDGHKLANNIMGSIIINKASFINALSSLMGAMGGDSSVTTDLIKSLNLDLSRALKIKLAWMMLKKEFTLLEVVNLANEILSNNGITKMDLLDRVIALSDGITLNVSDIFNQKSASAASDAFGKIMGSVRIDTTKLLYSLFDAFRTATFDKTKVSDGLSQITGFNSSKLSALLDGVVEICEGIEFDRTKVVLGISEILAGLGTGDFDVSNNIISFDREFFSSGLDNVLANFNYTRSDISKAIRNIISNYNMSVPDNLDSRLSDALNRNELNLTDISNIFMEIVGYNNMSGLNLKDLFNKSFINASKIINPNFNVSSIVKSIFAVIPYVKIDIDKISASRNIDPRISDGMLKVLSGIKINVTKVMAGIDKIAKIDYNKSEAAGILDDIKSKITINASGLLDGWIRVIDSLNISESGFYKGLAKIVSSFKFNRTAVYDALDEISDSVRFNKSLVYKGIYELADGLGVNVSAFMSKFFNKFGYAIIFDEYLAPGTYNITAEYLSAINDTAKLTVIAKKNTPISLNVAVDGYHVNIVGSLNPDVLGLVLLEIGDYDIFNLAVGGKFAFDDVFEPGTYRANGIYLGDLKYNPNGTSFSFTVKSQTKLTASKISTTYGNGKNLIVTLKDEKGNPVSGKRVTVKLNGKSYVRTTNSKGQISVAVPANLKPKTYAASVTFAGDGKYVKSSSSVKVVVSKATPKIAAKAKTFKKNVKIKKYTITLKNNKNKVMKNAKVTIRVNGKTYTAKTNSKGQATFKITKLTKKGTFKAAITYSGNSYYNKVTKKVNIRVK